MCVDSGVTRSEVQVSYKTQREDSDQNDQFQEQEQHAQISEQEQRQTESIARCGVTFRTNRVTIGADRVACQAIDRTTTTKITGETKTTNVCIQAGKMT